MILLNYQPAKLTNYKQKIMKQFQTSKDIEPPTEDLFM